MERTVGLSFEKIAIFYLCSFPIFLFLGYIDEGYYNFKFILDPMFWICIVFYGGLILPFQIAGFKLLYYKKKPILRTILAGSISYQILLIAIILKALFHLIGNIFS